MDVGKGTLSCKFVMTPRWVGVPLFWRLGRLYRLPGWCEASRVMVKKSNILVLPLCPKKHIQCSSLAAECLEIRPAAKALGCWLTVAKCEVACAQVDKEEGVIQGFCVRTGVASRTTAVTVPLC